jgi:hypothetical protein
LYNWLDEGGALIRISEVCGVKVRVFRPTRKRRSEAGIALLIAIFVLLLIAVVAIALVVSSGTESALAGNYRSSTAVYYAAVAGLEEARARLRSSSPNYFGTTNPGFLPAPGTPLAVCTPIYVLNPAAGEVVTPWDPGNPYYDNEYSQEFPLDCGGNPPPSPSPTALSVWNRNPLSGLPFPGPFYKWVRINGVSEQSLNVDAAPYDTIVENKLLYYGSAQPNPATLNDTSTGQQVYELTALAVLPNGSRKIVQYLAAATPLNLSFPAALTLDGNNVQFSVPTSTNFWVNGADTLTVGNCNPSASVTAVGYTNGGDASQANILTAIGPPPTPDRRCNYTNGSPCGSPHAPNVGLVLPFAPQCPGCNLTTVAGLNALVQAISQSADVVINGNATQSNMPSGMSATSPMTIVVNGNLTFNGWHSTGYGLLLVTGEFTYDPDASWDGIILVIGSGKIYSHQSGTGQLQGAVFLATTVDSAGNPLPSLGSPFFDYTSSSGSNGVYYSSCWVQAAQPISSVKILSFHEVSQ